MCAWAEGADQVDPVGSEAGDRAKNAGGLMRTPRPAVDAKSEVCGRLAP